VDDREPIFYHGVMEDCWLVVYRSDSGASPGSNQSPRGKLWVRRDGTVLRQQVMLFDATLTFDRLRDEEALALTRDAGPRWWSWKGAPHGDCHSVGRPHGARRTHMNRAPQDATHD